MELADWPWSSFHRYVRMGYYEQDWRGAVGKELEGIGDGELRGLYGTGKDREFLRTHATNSNPRPNRVNRKLTVVLFFSPGELPASQFDEPLEDLPARGLDGFFASEDGPGIVIQVVAHG